MYEAMNCFWSDLPQNSFTFSSIRSGSPLISVVWIISTPAWSRWWKIFTFFRIFNFIWVTHEKKNRIIVSLFLKKYFTCIFRLIWHNPLISQHYWSYIPGYPEWLEQPNPELLHCGTGLNSSLEWVKVVLLTTLWGVALVAPLEVGEALRLEDDGLSISYGCMFTAPWCCCCSWLQKKVFKIICLSCTYVPK